MSYFKLIAVVGLSLLPSAICPWSLGGGISTVSSATSFDSMLSQNTLVLAEFLNPECPHCIAFEKSGIFPTLAGEYPNVKLVKVSVAKTPELHQKYNISGTPTFIWFKNSEEVGRLEGRGTSVSSYESSMQQYFGISPKGGKG